MDLGRIKKLIKQDGDKFIVTESGEPELVIMSFKEYEKLAGAGSGGRELKKFQRLVYDLDPRGFEETEVVAPVIAESIGLPVRPEDISLEDLPL